MNGFRGVDLLICSPWIGLGWKLWCFLFLFLFFGMKREEDHKESEAIIQLELIDSGSFIFFVFF